MGNISINSWSFFTSLGGYGILNLACAKHLQRLGVDVYCAPEYIPKPDSFEWSILTVEERELLSKPFSIQKIGISGTTPFEFEKNKSEIRIAMTMAESDLLGMNWVQSCNKMTHIIVPNAFFKQSFERSGVTTPITILPSGIDTERYTEIDRKEKDVFTFGLCGYLNERKGFFETVQAFASEFGPDEPVQLSLHTSNPFARYYKKWQDPRITLTGRYKTFDEMRDWYHSLDCFVFPSKAEGIGYPPREAMSTGLPVIVTNYSGLEDIADSEYAYPINPSSFSPRTDMLEQPGNWANIDVKELMYWMRYVYSHKIEAKKKGKLAAIKMRENFSWPVCAQKIKDFLEVTYG